MSAAKKQYKIGWDGSCWVVHIGRTKGAKSKAPGVTIWKAEFFYATLDQAAGAVMNLMLADRLPTIDPARINMTELKKVISGATSDVRDLTATLPRLAA